MARPVVSQAAEDLYQVLSPLAYADEINDWALLHFCEAFIGFLQEVLDYTLDPPWSSSVDIDRATLKTLPWLAQFVGVTIPPRATATESEEQYTERLREYIRSTPGFSRGSPEALIAQARLHLIGNRTVIFRERWGGAYNLEIRTYTSETPDSAKVLAALLLQKPGGIILDYAVSAGQDYQQLFENYTDYQTVFTTYTNYQKVVEDAP